MKATININQKIGQPNYGSFGASCSFEIDIDQAALEKSPDTILAHCRLLADLARVAVERELDLQRRKAAPAREPGEDDAEDLRPGDPAYERARPPQPAARPPARQPYSQQDWERDQPDQRPYQGGQPPWQRQGSPPPPRGDQRSGPPKNGRQFLGWLGKQDPALKHQASQIAKAWNLPSMMRDWPDDAALAMYQELTRRPQHQPAWGGVQNGNGYHSNGSGY